MLWPQLVNYPKDGHVTKWATESPLWNCGKGAYGEGANFLSGETYNMQSWEAIVLTPWAGSQRKMSAKHGRQSSRILPV